ncbi:MAG: RecX family transcriptional regulator [Oscillospiraceae bacterium]|nr:RecX family transcriptional regulator [Oscillospiraceae bacterium]
MKKQIKMSAQNYVQYLLGRQNYTANKLRARLKNKGFPQSDTENAVAWAIENAYINESELMERQVELLAKRGYGKNIIYSKLRNDFFNPELMGGYFSQLCENIDFGPYCYVEVEKRLDKLNLAELDKDQLRKECEKIMRQVVSRGYSPTMVRNCLREYLSDE